MMDFFDSDKTDAQIDEGQLVEEGVHIMQLQVIEDGVAVSKKDQAEYSYWILKFRVMDGPSKDVELRQFMSFDRPGNLADMMILRRRKVLRALGIQVQPGQRMSLDQSTLTGRYVRAKVSHWKNRNQNGRLEAQIDEIEAYESQPAGGQLPSAQQPALQPPTQHIPPAQPPAQTLNPPPASYQGPAKVDEIPF